jgi:proteic killer suppression protein
VPRFAVKLRELPIVAGNLTNVASRATLAFLLKTFRHKGLKELWETGRTAKVPANLWTRCLNRLTVLNRAALVREATGSGFDTHPLAGTNPVRYALSVSGPWRITFQFENGDAHAVDLEQYH